MALTLSGGIRLSGQININVTPPVLSGPVFSYIMGNSASFNGQGLDLSYGNFIGPESSVNGTNYIFDTSADYANGSYGNIGFYYNDSLDPLTTYPPGNTFVNHGPLSYLSFNGLPPDDAPGTGQYVDSNIINGNVIPVGSSYTLFSVVRVNDFGPPDNPGTWTGGIVGGAQIIFGFIPSGIAPTEYPILYAGTDSLGGNGIADLSTPFQPNTWYAVAVTYNAISQTMNLYVNGVNTGNNTGIAPTTNDEPLYWGTWEGANWLNGDLAVMTAWDRVLSPSEIASYTTTYGNPYGVTSARQDNDMPLQTYSQLFSIPTGDPTIFTVPEGVTNISIVAVGAGGGGAGGDTDYYSPAGGDTYVYTAWDQRFSNFIPTNTGTNINQLIFNCSSPPTNSIIGNVAPGWLITGTQLNNTYPDKASIQGGSAIAVVTSIDTNDLSNVVVTLNMYIDSVTGGNDSFYFQGQGIVGAQGGWASNGQWYNGSTGPGQRAVPTICDGGGRGGVQDYFTADNVGSGGAGGYGTNAAIVAFDPNQTYLYNGTGNSNLGIANVLIELSNNNLTATAVGNNTNNYTAIGTYPIRPTGKVMFSITQDIWAGNDYMAVGLGNYNANIADYIGADTNSIGYWDDGIVYYNNTPVITGLPAFPDNDQIIDIAVDRNSDSMWVRIDGGDWNGNVSADPTTNLGGIEIMQGTPTDPNLYLMVSVGYNTSFGAMSINTSNAYSIPSGFTFVAGDGGAGSTGGDGSTPDVPTMKAGQGQGGSGGGGGGIFENTGAGAGGTGLYGVGENGSAGGWINENTSKPPDGLGLKNNTARAIGGQGGSTLGNSGTEGGMARQWAAGSGGWPGGAGGSGVDYYGGGNGGALAYKNNFTVTPGQTYNIIVGQGGTGSGFSGGVGGDGAVRIVWPGNTRTFPSTNVGLDPAGPTTLTINPNDLKDGGDTPVSSFSVGSVGTIGNNYVTLFPNSDVIGRTIFAFFRQLGLYTQNSLNNPYSPPPNDPNIFNAYIFNVTWTAGSEVLSGQIRMGYNGNYGALYLSPVDTGSSDWETASPLTYPGPSNPNLGGTFNFPATFTLYSPTTEANGNYWC